MLTHRQLRVIELVLFLGMTVFQMAGIYFVGSDLMHRGPSYGPILLAYIKDGLIQSITIMIMYCALIPNHPLVAARTLFLMFLGPIISMVLLRIHPDAASAQILEQLKSAEEAGSNILFLGIGMVVAIYSSFILNGLRTQLHEARKFGQYQLATEDRRGGMGEVYMAEHQLLKRPCAAQVDSQ